MHTTTNTPRRDLGNGLVMRWSTAEDTERIAKLHGLVHRNAAALCFSPNLHHLFEAYASLLGMIASFEVQYVC